MHFSLYSLIAQGAQFLFISGLRSPACYLPLYAQKVTVWLEACLNLILGNIPGFCSSKVLAVPQPLVYLVS